MENMPLTNSDKLSISSKYDAKENQIFWTTTTCKL